MQTQSGIVLATGASGRIGAAVTRRLRGRFEQVVGFDCAAPSPPPRDCGFIPAPRSKSDWVML